MSKPTPAERAAQLSEGLDYVKDLPGFERGHPHYFKDPMIDHLLEIVLQLGAELWIVKDRQMIVEHLLATEGKVTPEMIERFRPPQDLAQKLAEERRTLSRRLYQSLSDHMGPGGKAEFMGGVVGTTPNTAPDKAK
ncbi:MAG: hypothetical protein KDE14_00435 [Rhodobacteraceae bacterium]|nr:hypothetical protein [Paracoccaceae bacterium]